MAKTQLTGGAFQDAEGNVLANGYLLMQVNQDEQINGTNGQLCAGVQIKIALDSNGNVSQSPAQSLWPNDQLTPAGSWYIVYAYTQAGQLVWGPWYVTVPTNGGTYNVSNWVPGTVQTGALVGSITLQTNEVNNGSQSLFDLHAGSNVTLTDNGAGRVTVAATGGSADGASTVGGYVWSNGQVGYLVDAANSGTGQPFNSTNQLMCLRVYITKSINISKVTVCAAGASGSTNINVGFYNDSGNLVVDSGAINVGAAAGGTVIMTNTITPALITPGWYWFACAGTAVGGSANVAIYQAPGNNTNQKNIWIQNNTGAQMKVATAANARAANALPSTLGTLTASSFTQHCIALFEQ